LQTPAAGGRRPPIEIAPTPRSYKLRAWLAVASLIGFLAA
jgi:hypothetical protein